MPLDPIPGRVADPIPWAEAESAVLRTLEDGVLHGLGELQSATKSLWPDGAMPQRDMAVYEILRALHSRGRVVFESRRVPGVLPGLTAPQIRVRVAR